MELLGLGIYLAVVVVVPLLVGLRVDDALHSSPAGLLLGVLLGMVAGFIGVYVRIRQYL